MATPDNAFGISADFPEDTFRNAIHFAMQMGFNPDEAKQPVFLRKGRTVIYKKNGVEVATPRMDRDGKPLDPDIEVVRAADEQVKVLCALEVTTADAEELPVGNFRPTKVTVTLMDAEYEKVKDCRELSYNGDRYLYGYEPESVGLFEVGFATMIFYALDES